MKSVVKEINIREEVGKYFHEYGIEGLDINAISAALFSYAKYCKSGGSFNDKDSYELIKQFTDDPVVAKELWAILTLFCFENLVYKLIQEKKCTNVDDAFGTGCYTITACARSFAFDGETAFSTYVHTAIENNLNRDKWNSWMIPVPDHLRKTTAVIIKEMESGGTKSNEELAAELDTTIQVVGSLVDAVKNRVPLSLEASTRQGEIDQMVSGNYIASDENVQNEFLETEAAFAIRTKLFPTIADIYDNETAYIARMRTSSVFGGKRIGFKEMVPEFCRYLATVNNLHIFVAQFPQYEPLCNTIESMYATSGLAAVNEYLDTCSSSEASMIRSLMSYSDNEALEMVKRERENDDCYEMAVDIRKRFAKVFPADGTKMSKKDLGRNRRFRRELRMMGLEQVADAMLQNSRKLRIE